MTYKPLISGQNIKTVNSNSLLGVGDLTISTGNNPISGSGPPLGIIPAYEGQIYVDIVGKQFYSGSVSDANSWYRLISSKTIGILLLHFNGENGSTSFPDDKGNIFARNGSPIISATKSKFGGASGYFPGSGGSCITTPTSSVFNLGTDDFTLEFWYAQEGTPESFARLFSSQMGDVSAGYVVYFNGSILAFGCGTAFTLNFNTITDNNFHHYAVVRSGNNFYTFTDGVLMNSTNSNTSIVWSSSNTIAIGGQVSPSRCVNGYIDELRLIRGVGLYTANFTPPAAPFTN